jgi:phosphoglycolate phosphatase
LIFAVPAGKLRRLSPAIPWSQPSPMSRRDALVFDLDGTLFDTAPDLHRCVNAVLAEQGRASVPLADVRPMVGDGAAKLIERGFAATGAALDPARLAPLMERFLHHYHEGRHALTRPFPGVADTLIDLAAAGFRLGICTNKPYGPTMEILEVLEMDHLFHAVGGGDSFAARKPDPGHLLGVLKLMGAQPNAAVMIGDSYNDVMVAKAAGVPVIAVSYGYTTVPVDQLGADHVIDSFAELTAIVAQIVPVGQD